VTCVAHCRRSTQTIFSRRSRESFRRGSSGRKEEDTYRDCLCLVSRSCNLQFRDIRDPFSQISSQIPPSGTRELTIGQLRLSFAVAHPSTLSFKLTVTDGTKLLIGQALVSRCRCSGEVFVLPLPVVLPPPVFPFLRNLPGNNFCRAVVPSPSSTTQHSGNPHHLTANGLVSADEDSLVPPWPEFISSELACPSLPLLLYPVSCHIQLSAAVAVATLSESLLASRS